MLLSSSKNSKFQSKPEESELKMVEQQPPTSMNLQDLFNSMKFHESKEAKEKEQFKREQEQLREKIAQASPKSKMEMAWQLEDSISSDSDHDE